VVIHRSKPLLVATFRQQYRDGVEFRILGPLEAWANGSPLELGAGRQRALLALLLMHENEVVSTDRLIEGLWGEHAPRSAAKVVQNYVSQLRRALPPETIHTRGPGYLVAAANTDAGKFERLLKQSRREEPREAAQTLRTALALWRGCPYADVEYEGWAQAEIARLEELRLVALEERIDAELRLGDAARLVPELEALVAERPLRERPRAQLMLALYRSGRQADALEAYTEARRRLVEELGIEPGPELQDLQRRMLAQDPELAPVPHPLARVVRRANWLVVAGIVLIAAAATPAGLLLTNGSRGGSLLGSGEIGVIDAASHRILTGIPIPGGPAMLAATGGSVWVGSDQSGTLAEIDQPARRATSTLVSTSGFPSALAVGEGAVWVLDGQSGLLAKVSPPYTSVERRVRVSAGDLAYDRSRESLDPSGLAVGLGSVWTTDGSRRLTRVDPTTMKVVGRYDLGARLDGVTVGDGAVWAISGTSAVAIEVNRLGRATTRIPIASRPRFESPYPFGIAWGDGFVWVLNGNTATLTKIDPTQRTVAATIEIGIDRAPARLAVGAGAAWVADADGTLARVDANTNALDIGAVAHKLEDVAVVGRTVWVTTGAGQSGRVVASASVGIGRVRALPTSSCSPMYYQAGSRPRYLVVADVPLQGPASIAAQVAEAAQLVLSEHRYRAGRYTLGYQICDASTVQAQGPSPARCAADAHAYAQNPSVIGVISAHGSACSQVELPIADRAPGGPLAMIAAGDSYVGLTHRGPGTDAGEPGRYYPTGTRNYVRLTAADDVQGAADALLARRLGAKTIYLLNGGLAYGDGLTAAVGAAAAKLGLTVVGSSRWNFEARSNQRLVARVRLAHPDAVFLASFLFPPSTRLIKDLRTGLPTRTRLLLPDGFEPGTGLIASIGSTADGITISVAEVPNSRLPKRGRQFTSAFEKSIGGVPPNPYAVAEAAATEVLLDAIGRSNGTRTSVSEELFKTRITNGILGSFAFDRNGDTTADAITIYRIDKGAPRIYAVITPPPRLVH
jgi:DNA-binding SARP family transcriptional activator/ABC-type branched-subunit amino acid transport system substrate-binding protein/DNA-binding beta-propeller fold protein YncE